MSAAGDGAGAIGAALGGTAADDAGAIGVADVPGGGVTAEGAGCDGAAQPATARLSESATAMGCFMGEPATTDMATRLRGRGRPRDYDGHAAGCAPSR